MSYKNKSTGQTISDHDYHRLPNDKKRLFVEIGQTNREGQEGRRADRGGDDLLDTMIVVGILGSMSNDTSSYDSSPSIDTGGSSDFGGFGGGDGGGGGASGDF